VPNFLYVDNSNVRIEEMHVAAVRSRLALDISSAQEHKICDYGWKMDFGRLLEFAGGKREEVGRAPTMEATIGRIWWPFGRRAIPLYAGRHPTRVDLHLEGDARFPRSDRIVYRLRQDAVEIATLFHGARLFRRD
jgi:hypothetical protein